MSALYSELDPFCCDWLANLQAAGHIAPGRVLRGDFRDYVHTWGDHSRVHFFAGLGGWDYALRLAGWPDDAPVWTGSCPCQPFSTAGKRKGVADDRHLWPDWFKLIDQHRPPVIFGEQVASPDGRAWLDAVQADLEGAGYTVGKANLCAAGIGAPHLRQRLYFVAIAGGKRCEGVRLHLRERRSLATESEAARRGAPSVVGDTNTEGAAAHRRIRLAADVEPTRGYWSGADWTYCKDGKYRPVEPGSFPLAHGVSARVGRLRAYGNAIVPQVAAQFIGAVMEYLQ